jgi:5-dehydro-4-deoxyglucarate dehydratase
MHPTELADRLAGVIGFPITPFRADAEMTIDVPAFRDHVDGLADGGLAAMVVAGGTGEFFSLTPHEIADLAREALAAADGRVPILVGVGHGAAIGRELAKELEAIGVDGLLLMPPYYPTPDPATLADYYATIAGAAPGTGVVVYSRDHARLDIPALQDMSRIDNLVAVKDGLGDIRSFTHNRSVLGERYKWLGGAGDDLVGAYAASGAEGYTSSLACIDASLSLRLWTVAQSGDWQELDVLMRDKVTPWYVLRRNRRGYEVSTIKAALTLLGRAAGPVRPPLANVTEEDQAQIRALLQNMSA